MTKLLEGLRRGFFGAVMALFASYTMLVTTTLNSGIVAIDSSLLAKHYVFYALSGLYLAGSSIIFNIDRWTIKRQFITHMLCTVPFLPLAYLVGIMPHTSFGITIFSLSYITCYLVSYILYQVHYKNK